MVMTMGPHVAAVQEAVVMGVAGADGAAAEVEELDIPPPHALIAAMAKVHAAAGNHRRGFAQAIIARSEHCIEISSLCWFCP
jgi:hypothetical protein